MHRAVARKAVTGFVPAVAALIAIDGAGRVPPPYGALLELTEACIAPTRGFGMQPYRDVEILTIVLDGALGYRDTLGNGAIVRAGGVQR
ncbi:hypothetical protein DN583_31065, partial [Burkholderia multivorans]